MTENPTCFSIDATEPGSSAEAALARYAMGLYPMPGLAGGLRWCTFRPAAGAAVADLRVPRRLRKTLRHRPYEVAVDRDFEAVVRACAETDRPFGWITSEVVRIAVGLHAAGYAHSLECRLDGRLVGGLYGLALGRLFIGESMFTQAPDAGSIAFVHLAALLDAAGFALLDAQMASAHMRRYGVRTIPHDTFFPARHRAIAGHARFPADRDPAELLEPFLAGAVAREAARREP